MNTPRVVEPVRYLKVVMTEIVYEVTFLHFFYFLGPSDLTRTCTSNPCQNGGTCYDYGDSPGFICSCPLGFEGFDCGSPGVSK